MGAPVEIHVLNKQVRLLQPEKGFRTSLDSVMVAAACPAADGQSVLDMGCGVGAVAFCILHRVPGAAVTGIDVQTDYIDLAQKNIGLNEVAGVNFVCADVRVFQADARFDHVVCNPPFLEAGHYTPSPDAGNAKARGHDEEDMGVGDWVDAAFRNLKSGGSLTMIHRADFIDRIIQALGRRFGAVELIPLWPRTGVAAKRVIVRAVKDRKSPATVNAGLVLHEADGSYTAEADKVLRGGEALLY